jgi:hypothetical protein
MTHLPHFPPSGGGPWIDSAGLQWFASPTPILPPARTEEERKARAEARVLYLKYAGPLVCSFVITGSALAIASLNHASPRTMIIVAGTVGGFLLMLTVIFWSILCYHPSCPQTCPRPSKEFLIGTTLSAGLAIPAFLVSNPTLVEFFAASAGLTFAGTLMFRSVKSSYCGDAERTPLMTQTV